MTTFTQTSSHHTNTTPTPHQHHNRLKLVWCGCGVAYTTPTAYPHHNHTTPTPQPFKVSVLWLCCGCGVAYTTTTPQPHHSNFKRLWCWCGVVVVWVLVRAGLGEVRHLWATVAKVAYTIRHIILVLSVKLFYCIVFLVAVPLTVFIANVIVFREVCRASNSTVSTTANLGLTCQV